MAENYRNSYPPVVYDNEFKMLNSSAASFRQQLLELHKKCNYEVFKNKEEKRKLYKEIDDLKNILKITEVEKNKLLADLTAYKSLEGELKLALENKDRVEKEFNSYKNDDQEEIKKLTSDIEKLKEKEKLDNVTFKSIQETLVKRESTLMNINTAEERPRKRSSVPSDQEKALDKKIKLQDSAINESRC